MFKRLLQQLRPKAVLVKYPEPLKPEQIANIFHEYGEDSKIWQALDAVIDQQLLDAVNEVSEAKAEHCARAHASGRIDAISTLKGRLEEFKKWNTQRNRNLK